MRARGLGILPPGAPPARRADARYRGDGQLRDAVRGLGQRVPDHRTPGTMNPYQAERRNDPAAVLQAATRVRCAR